MPSQWTAEDIAAHFTLEKGERAFVGINAPHNLLGKALLLKFFQSHWRFPEDVSEIPREAIGYLANQLYISDEVIQNYQWTGRTINDHRRAIRERYGFQVATIQDQNQIQTWLQEEILPDEYRSAHLQQIVYNRLIEQKREPPTRNQVDRLIKSAIYQYQEAFFQRTYHKLSDEVRQKLRNLVSEAANWRDQTTTYAPLHELKLGAGAATVVHIQRVCNRLQTLQAIQLPANLFEEMPMIYLKQYQQQVSVESPSHLLKREETNPEQMYSLLAIFCWVRQRQVTDDLVDLFIRVLKTIQIRAESRETRRLLADFIRVEGKQQLLFRLAEAMWEEPQGVIETVLYPIIGVNRLEALVEEAKQTGSYRQAVQTRIGGSYSYHYRRMLPPMLEVLTFRSNNARHQPLIQALKVVESHLADTHRFYPADVVIPIEDVVPTTLQTWIYQANAHGKLRIRRTRYELCVLQQLRRQLRSKEIWVVGADRYRNPDEDVPSDFNQKRSDYFHALGLPLDVDDFISRLQQDMKEALRQFHDGLSTNDHVSIISSGRIRIKKLSKQEEPTNLVYLRNHIKQEWWLINLLDVLKEVDLQVQFTQHFNSLTGQKRLTDMDLQKRLLLCLYGLGTNTGLSRVSVGNHGINESQLRYVRRRFISCEGLRAAITHVVNATLAIKNPAIWGETATWSASDSKQFGAWDQNLRAQWHRRYRQSGVMVYWHVSNQSLCIYSQLKAPSSSEVASMIEGVLRHCTEMQVDRNYVDTHGQSEVAFAFCHLLGFQLMPRLKNIYEQQLHVPDKGDYNDYPELAPILTTPIDWDLIRQQYDEMVKYATALRLGTAQTEAILKRFTRNNIQHPTYKAFSELGRVIKTIFLCRYLHDVEVRREILEGLNTVESWNSANGFIFFGKQGDIATNDVDAQEVTVLAMHLSHGVTFFMNKE